MFIERIHRGAESGVVALPMVSPGTLAELSKEIGRLSQRILELGAEPIDPLPLSLENDGSAVPSASALRSAIRGRRARDKFFRAELFADPAWDILLDLLLAHVEGTKVSVSSLSIAAAVPATTALRWITLMTEQGLLERQCDPEDGRRIFVGLTGSALDAMKKYFRQNPLVEPTCTLPHRPVKPTTPHLPSATQQ